MLTSFQRVFKTGWSNFSRNMGLNFATVFIIGVTVFQVSALYILYQTSESLIDNMKAKADISVYFNENSSEGDIMKVKDAVAKMNEVKNVEYISNQEALDKFLETHKDDPSITESVTEVGSNPFLASLSIHAAEASQYDAVEKFLSQGQYKDLVYKVDYFQRKTVIEKIEAMSKGISRVELFFSAFFALVALFVAFNTVRLAIYNSKEEIGIMRLVGASNWFIKGPFLVQGIAAGAISFLIVFALTGIAAFLLDQKLAFFFSDLHIFKYFISNLFTILLIQLATGIGLGVLSSMVAIRKYLKV